MTFKAFDDLGSRYLCLRSLESFFSLTRIQPQPPPSFSKSTGELLPHRRFAGCALCPECSPLDITWLTPSPPSSSHSGDISFELLTTCWFPALLLLCGSSVSLVICKLRKTVILHCFVQRQMLHSMCSVNIFWVNKWRRSLANLRKIGYYWKHMAWVKEAKGKWWTRLWKRL